MTRDDPALEARREESAARASEAYRGARMRSGEDYLRSLKDGRRVYADGLSSSRT